MQNESKKKERVLLIVEDEQDLQDILKDSLQPVCDRILTASNGIEALAILKENPDLCAILSDITMPRMNGLQLLAEVRGQFNPIPFVVLTGFGNSTSFKEAVKLNATDFLEKPFVEKELLDVMGRAIQYGFELQAAEKELILLLESSGVPADKIEKMRRAKRTVIAMRIESSIYVKMNEK